MKSEPSFVKAWSVARFDTIVMMRRQDKNGAPELRFYFRPEGFGVCDFGLGFCDDEDNDAETKLDTAFAQIGCQDAIKLIDGWLATMRH